MLNERTCLYGAVGINLFFVFAIVLRNLEVPLIGPRLLCAVAGMVTMTSLILLVLSVIHLFVMRPQERSMVPAVTAASISLFSVLYVGLFFAIESMVI